MSTKLELKEPFGRFPPDIWETITLNLNTADAFILSCSNKAMWKLIRHIPMNDTLEIYTSKPNIGSFFLTNICSVIIRDDDLNHENLTAQLAMFANLNSVYFLTRIFSLKQAKKLLLCLPRRILQRGELRVIVNKENADEFHNAKKQLSFEKLRVQNDREAEHRDDGNNDSDSDAGYHQEKKFRTPSPVRSDVLKMKNQIGNIKKRFNTIAQDPTTLVPQPLRSVYSKVDFIDSSYITADFNNDPTTKAEADAFVDRACSRFIESIAVSSEGSYMLITQAEAYFRNTKDVDDCANSTITIDYPSEPIFVIEQKREFSNQWLEAKIYFKKFEFLVTGCLHGKFDEDGVKACLGASIGSNHSMKDYWRIYVPVTSVPVVNRCRLLRNFTKNASGFNWLLVSKRFNDRFFTTACPVNLYSMDNNIDIVIAIGSLLLKWRAYGETDLNMLSQMLEALKLQIGLKQPCSSSNIAIIEASKIGKGKKLALKMALSILNGKEISSFMYVEMFKALLTPKLKAINNKTLRKKYHEAVLGNS